MHRQGEADRHLRRDPASRRGRGDGAGRARFHLHRLGACARSPATRSRIWCAPPTCIGVPAMVRVPGHAPEAIAAALDSGAHGVLVPRVSTAAQARAAVKAARYPPQGERGVGPGRAAGYGYRILEYLAEANAEDRRRRPGRDRRRARQCRRDRGDRRRRRGLRRPGRSLGVDRRYRAGRRATSSRKAIETIIARDAAARQDRRHLLRQAGGRRPMGGKGRQLLHPGQRHDVSRRRRRGQRCARKRASAPEAAIGKRKAAG